MTSAPETMHSEAFGDVLLRGDLADTAKQAFRFFCTKNSWIVEDMEKNFIGGVVDTDGFFSIEISRPVFSEYKVWVKNVRIRSYRQTPPRGVDPSAYGGEEGWWACEPDDEGAVAYWELLF